ncbi:MAG TPA: TonB-dependent receptor plug domain-containing protein, partial [Longimicrobiales bacterium]|nr:TonB-dependent receptor plug domain-containing protein [Longimicrobiales bacterium]
IEESPATSTEQLLAHIPGVRVADVRLVRPQGVPGGDTVLTSLPRPDVGETVQIRGPGGRWCTPTVYVDGLRSFYTTDALSSSVAVTLSTLTPLAAVEAIEVYRRPAEVPMEYSSVGTGSGGCGVLVVWTDTGSTRGAGVSLSGAGGGPAGGAGVRRPLPSVDAEGPPPSSGEHIRMQLGVTVAERLGLPSPWEATFLAVRDRRVLGRDDSLGRAFAVPLDGVEALQVRRERTRIHAFERGAIAGAASGVAMWQFLRILCSDRCGGGVGSDWFPASALGLVVGVLVGSQGPGTHWVRAPLPEEAGPPFHPTPAGR